MTKDAQYSAVKAGYRTPGARGAQNLAKPAVQAEIVRVQTERLYNDLLPAAIGCLQSIMLNEKAPAGARVSAAKVVFDRTLGTKDAGQQKELHEMTPAEINAAIEQLKREASERAKPIIEGSTSPAPSIFE